MTARLTRLARLAAPDAAADAELLARFVAARDGEAFAELVRRHGPAVQAVCRRVTSRTPDAEDAFQAAFLVLARKAHRVRPGAPLAAWLYGVALRTARKAAARTTRSRETVAAVPDVPARPDGHDPEAVRAVAEEVGRLGEKYRAAVVLCELEGRPRAAAARELGVAEGTLSSRLAAARKLLAARLAARGFGPAALLALAADPVPPDLAAAASAVASGPVPPAVASLAHGVTRAMTLKSLRPAALVLGLAAAVVAAGLGTATPPAPKAAPPSGAGDQPAPTAPPAPAPAVPAAGGELLLLWCGGNPVLLRPDGTEVRKLPGTGFEDAQGLALLHPDGKRFAYTAEEQPRPKLGDPRTEVYVRDLDAPGLGTAVDGAVNGMAVAWGDAGARLYGGFNDPKQADTAWNADADGKDLFLFAGFPKDHRLIDRSPDGRHLLALRVNTDVDGPPVSAVHLLRADRTHVALVSPPRYQVGAARFAPDGKSILIAADPPADAADPGRPVILQVSMKDLSESTVTRLPKGATIESVCGSPDGTRVAYAWYQAAPEGTPAREYVYRLTVCDLHGENAKELYRRKGSPIGSVDWRGTAAAVAAADPPAFDEFVAEYNPGAFSPQVPATLRFTPDGKCVYEVAAIPGRGNIPPWPAAKLTHQLPPDRARRLAALLKATDGLAKPIEKEVLQLHQAKYALTLRRGGAAAKKAFEGEPTPYTDLLVLARGLAAQEFLAYELEVVPGRSGQARSNLDTYVRAELGGPYAKPVDAFDFTRFAGWATRLIRAPADHPADDVATAARLAGLLRLSAERDALTALARHENSYVREAANLALARIADRK